MIRVGTVVRLRRKFRGKRSHKWTAKVAKRFQIGSETYVTLDREMAGFWNWPARNLESASRAERLALLSR